LHENKRRQEIFSGVTCILGPVEQTLGTVWHERNRLEMVGGRFDFELAPGKVIPITAQIPFGKTNARRDC
jgi:hypothetical protein